MPKFKNFTSSSIKPIQFIESQQTVQRVDNITNVDSVIVVVAMETIETIVRVHFTIRAERGLCLHVQDHDMFKVQDL